MKFDYLKPYRKQVMENVKLVLAEIDADAMTLKISNWAGKFGYSKDEVYKKIKRDAMFRCVFSKDPSKQNIYENLALSFLKKIPDISNPIKDGKKHIVNGRPVDDSSAESKSVDFIWESIIDGKCYNCYATHKHTQGAGGAQDNQFEDLKSFIKNCINSNGKITKDAYFFAICDGDYYTPKKKKEMKNLAPPNCFVGDINELSDFLDKNR